jgi:hypothetical protein
MIVVMVLFILEGPRIPLVQTNWSYKHNK